MSIEFRISSVKDLLSKGADWEFIFDSLHPLRGYSLSKQNAEKRLLDYLGYLKEDTIVVIESEYVDKVFRDTYYHYFASKLDPVERNCIRLSFIDSAIGCVDFTEDKLREINNYYRGFTVVRPLDLAPIGRNTISPDIIKRGSDFSICKAPIPSSCLGIKTVVHGFPHSSQDQEMMTCAETTVWSILEYFGNKYPELSTILPSEIHSLLKPHAFQRQIPSNGLTFDQIARVFNNHGFGSKIYTESNSSFFDIFSTYLESGIPIAVCLQSDTIGHAVVALGHRDIDPNSIGASAEFFVDGVKYYSWNKLSTDVIFNDDNLLPYAVAPFSHPVANYSDKAWDGVEITMFIVPLNNKIYMDAEKAIGFSNLLVKHLLKASPNSVLRTFLASGRSYKEYLMTNPDIPDHWKHKYFQIPMAKFVWVTEIADLDTCKKSKVNGILIVDATNPQTDNIPMIFAQYKGDEMLFNSKTCRFIRNSLTLPFEFEAFTHNLT